MAQAMERIGFVGVGRMGANMGRRLKDVGGCVTACTMAMAKGPASFAQEIGAESAQTPARVAELATVIFTVVTDDAGMRGIFAADDSASLLAQAKGRLFVNCATVSPEVHIEVEALVEQEGGQSTALESCMASSIPQARDGTLYLMCGGKAESYLL